MATMVYTVTVAGTGQSFPCAADVPVFDAMVRARGPVSHGCGGGGCGACRMRVVSGEYEQFKRMSRAHVTAEAQAERGEALLCCIYPRSDLVVAPCEGG
jgi:ferredoxin